MGTLAHLSVWPGRGASAAFKTTSPTQDPELRCASRFRHLVATLGRFSQEGPKPGEGWEQMRVGAGPGTSGVRPSAVK